MYAIVDYTLVPTTADFAQLFKEGWMPHGSISFNSANNPFQALIKYDTTLLMDAEERVKKAEARLEESEDRAATAEAQVEELQAELETKTRVQYRCLPTFPEFLMLILLIFPLQAYIEEDPTRVYRRINEWGTYVKHLLA